MGKLAPPTLAILALCALWMLTSCKDDEPAPEPVEVAEVPCKFAEYGIECPAPPQLGDGTDFSNWEPANCPKGFMPGCQVVASGFSVTKRHAEP